MKHGIVAGSFDPITNGHVWLIKQALKLASRVTIVVGVNPSKKYMFTMAERIDLVNSVLVESLPPDDTRRINVVSLENELLVNYAKSIYADLLIRGIRNATDFSYESEILLINRNIQPTIDTVYVVPPRELTEVSSSTVKGLVGFTGWQQSIKTYVDPIVIEALENKSPVKVVPVVDPHECRVTASGILSELKRRRAHQEDTANMQLQEWTDGPKIVIDFMGVIPVAETRYTTVCTTNWNTEGPYIIDYIKRYPLATVFVKGSDEQFDLVRQAIPQRNNVVKLLTWYATE